MLNNSQIKLVQMAVKQAGIRLPKDDRRYRLLLGQYKQSNGSRVTSCKQLNNSQIEDLLAICESMGWQYPGRPNDFFRKKVEQKDDFASFAQQSAIKKLAGDLGWNINQLNGFIKKMTNDRAESVAELAGCEAYKITEALKAMFSRQQGKTYKNLKEIQSDMEVNKDGQKQACKIG